MNITPKKFVTKKKILKILVDQTYQNPQRYLDNKSVGLFYYKLKKGQNLVFI